LRKALIIKADRDFYKNQLDISRDSVKLLTHITNNQDSVIKTQDSTITIYTLNEHSFIQIIDNKETEINLFKEELNTQRNHKRIAIGVAVLSIFLGALIVL